MFVFLKKFLTQTKSPSKHLGQWLPLIYTICLVGLGFIFLFELGAGQMLPAYSEAELKIAQITQQMPNPLEHFLYWPYYVGVYALRLAVDDGVVAARILSALSGIVACGSLLFLCRRKFGIFISLTGVSLFALNSWILHLVRLGEPHINVLAISLSFLMCLSLAKIYKKNLGLKIITTVCGGLCWFMPLMPWLISGLLLNIWLKYKYFQQKFNLQLNFQIILAGIFIGLISLMIVSWTKAQADILIAWGVPASWLSLREIVVNFLTTMQALFWQAPYNPGYWLARLPFLDIFLATMIPFGIYATRKKLTRMACLYVGLASLVLLLVASLGDGIQTEGLVFILLFSVLAVIAGLNEFLTYWQTIFPSNPLAKILGISVIIFLINFSLFYQLQKYFRAWMNYPQAQQIYNCLEIDAQLTCIEFKSQSVNQFSKVMLEFR